MSASTVVGIHDRLEAKDLIDRQRDSNDRRLVNVTISESDQKLIDRAPPLLQEYFVAALQLFEREQVAIATSLERVAVLMNVDAGGSAPSQ